MCEISVIIILIYQKVELVKPVRQKTKLPLPKYYFECVIQVKIQHQKAFNLRLVKVFFIYFILF